MGVVNVTPDSFSDGGRFLEPEAAVAHGQRLAEEGAGILDVGGESTRPGADPVAEDEELRRVLPVVEGLVRSVSVPISIDTRKPAVAAAALDAGASIVNDIEAHRGDPGMWEIVARHGAGYLCMHMQGTPQTMQTNPEYSDPVREVAAFFEDRLARLSDAGVEADRVVLDPGIGFGKSLEHNLRLLAGLKSFMKLHRPVALGVSRKSFIGRLLGVETAERLPASLACSCWAVGAGVQILRTHDVRETVQAVRMFESILAT